MPIAWHAPYELLKPETRDMARAIHSLMEELEAMDWYSQRIDVTDDKELAEVLYHHADEEKEHAAMLLEWIRRRDPQWDKYLREYLFTSGNLLNIEEGHETQELSAEGFQVRPAPTPAHPQAAPQAQAAAAPIDISSGLTVGSLRPRRA